MSYVQYAQIARNETESKIPYIEGCSKVTRIVIIFLKDNDNHI